MITTCLQKILVERAPQEACEYVKGVISDLLMNKLDLSLLVISKVGPGCDASSVEASSWGGVRRVCGGPCRSSS